MACRTSGAKRLLVRIVRTPDGRVLADPSGKMAGRGAYLCADGHCWGAALDKGLLARALKTPIPESLREELAAMSATMTTNDREGGQRGEE